MSPTISKTTPGMLPLHDYIETLNIQHPIRGRMPLRTYDFQKKLLDVVTENPLVALLTARQMGLSTILMAWSLWKAAFHADSHVVVMGPRFFSAVENLDRLRFMMEHSPAGIPYVKSNTKSRIEFNNGSSISARSIGSGVDMDEVITDVIVTDAMFAIPSQMAATWSQMQPHMVGGTRCVLQSTAGKPEGTFYNVWRGIPGNGFVGMDVNWKAHPDRDDAWAEPYRTQLGQEMFAREFENQFS